MENRARCLAFQDHSVHAHVAMLRFHEISAVWILLPFEYLTSEC